MFQWLDTIFGKEDIATGGGVTEYTDWDVLNKEAEEDKVSVPTVSTTGGGDVGAGYRPDYVDGYEPDWEAIADEDSAEIDVQDVDMKKEVLQRRAKGGE